MTGYNLPPGCSVNDIPGNRPEDFDEDDVEQPQWLIDPADGRSTAPEPTWCVYGPDPDRHSEERCYTNGCRNQAEAEAIATYCAAAFRAGMNRDKRG